MARHRSIGDRMRQALNPQANPQARWELLHDWSGNWRDEQMGLVRQLEQAIKAIEAGRSDAYDLFCVATGQLKALTEKRFEGLRGVLLRLEEASRA